MSYMDQRVSSSTHPSSKREFGAESEGSDEYEFVQPLPKRPRDSNYEVAMSQPSSIKVYFPIPESCVGLVIGRNGSEIQTISAKTSCRVQVAVEKSTTGVRMVEIDGTPENIEMAKVHISDVVARGSLRPPPGSSQVGLNQQKVSIDIAIPAKKCGAIIGKGGETMRKLRTYSKCHIQLIQDSNVVSDTPKPLRVVGTPEAVEVAKKMVCDILHTADETQSQMVGNAPTSTVSVQVKVPRSTVGAIMGVSGKNIRKLSDETGTKIQFIQDDDAKLVERTLVIVGQQNKVFMAAQLIKEIVEANNAGGNVPVALFYLSIPSSKCGLVIGRGGDTIKQINMESGAHCELSRDPSVHPQEKVFVIRGTEVQVEHAKHLICQRVGDIPLSTPFNPYAFKRDPPQASMTSPFDGHPIIQGTPSQPAPAPQQHPGVIRQWDGPPIIQGQPTLQGQPHQQMIPQGHMPQQVAFQPTAAVDWQQVQAQRAQQMGQYNQNAGGTAPMAQQVFQQQQQIQQQQLQQQQLQHQQMQQQQMQQQMQQMQNMPAQAQQPSAYHQKFAAQPVQQQYAPQHLVQQHQVQQQPIQQHMTPHQPTLAAAVQMAKSDGHAAKVDQQTKEDEKEGEPDFSAQWLEYYISIGDTTAADGVRARIAQLKEEKAQKHAAASRY